jgi:flagellar protein FlaG
MNNSLSIIPPGPEAPGADSQSTPNHPQPGRRPAPAPQPEEAAPHYDPEQRLVIQEIGDTGDFVYTVIDRASGQVVAKATRDEVAHMSERADYAAGSLIKTKA